MIEDIVEGGLWDRSQPLADVVDLLNRGLKSDHVCADTVTKAMDDLFAETQDARCERRRKRPKAPAGS